jgi:hypothetical protein
MTAIGQRVARFLQNVLQGDLCPKEKTRQNLRAWRVLQCRGDWIRTSDLLNPILGDKAASSRRMSQMQAFW